MSAFETQVGGDHYKKLAIQPTQYAMANGLDACQFSVVKYVTRHRDKGGKKDLEKAMHFLQMLIELEYPEDEAMEVGPTIAPMETNITGADDDGWIEWHGVGKPDFDGIVDVKMRGGTKCAGRVEFWRWSRFDERADIIAWRPAKGLS